MNAEILNWPESFFVAALGASSVYVWEIFLRLVIQKELFGWGETGGQTTKNVIWALIVIFCVGGIGGCMLAAVRIPSVLFQAGGYQCAIVLMPRVILSKAAHPKNESRWVKEIKGIQGVVDKDKES